MVEKYPPMNAVKAFESVSRWGSMARAAEELGVTPSAVSHQVRALELWLGRAIFDRKRRQLKLTEEGRRFFNLVKPAFDQIRSVADILVELTSGRLEVLICPSLASTWLTPRLADFAALHPQIDVILHSRTETVDLTESDFGCAIRYCDGVPDRHVGDLLLQESVFPVCAPSLLEREPKLQSVNDLQDHVLLHDVLGDAGVTACNWSSWFSEIGLHHLRTARGHGFSDSNIMYEAACHGAGVALGRSVLVEQHLAQGRLVKPFDVARRSSHAWYFISTPAKLAQSPIAQFRKWLLDEAEATFLALNTPQTLPQPI